MSIFEKYQSNVLYEQPIHYMGCVLYPVLMKDVIEFNKVAKVLMINPLDFNDPKIASMSYLELILNLASVENEFKINLLSLLRLVFHVEDVDIKVDISRQEKQNIFTLYIRQDEEKWIEISASKFSKIKDVICFQNGLEILDLKQNQSIIEAKRAIAQKSSSKDAPTISEQIYSVSCVMQADVKDIMKWTINRFNETLKACDRIIHYKIYRSAEMSGMVTFKNGIPIKSWLKNEDNSEGKMKTLSEASGAFGGVVK